MRVYADSSALIKRVISEPESDALEAYLERQVDKAALLVSSSLAWIEVGRAVRSAWGERAEDGDVNEALDVALSGIAQRPMTEEIVSLARRIGPRVLRTLDAIHLATAVLLDVDQVLTYDNRLAEACRHNGLAVSAPGR